jgi:hypothetical protein
MENVHKSRVDVEFSIEWARNNPDLFTTQYNEFFRDHMDGWLITSSARSGFLTLAAERVYRGQFAVKASLDAVSGVPLEDMKRASLTELREAALQSNNAEWLISGSLLYRLTDDSRPENCDEINVTMADGSRESGPREARALQLRALLEHEESLKQALRWALEWIDAVPDDVMLPGMPGFDRDYVNGLLEGPDGTVE